MAGRAVRSLVVAPQWIGDAVMCQPLLAALAARGETSTVAALPAVAPVFRAMADVAGVIELPFAHGRLDLGARWRLGREWRGRFDVAYVLPNSIKSALLPFFARISKRIGYRGENRIGILTERLPNRRGRPPMVAHYGALAGAGFDASARPRLALPPAVVAGTLAAHGLVARAFVAFAPGADYGPAKRWPAERYAELASRLHGRDGLPIVLLGSPGERVLCEAVAAAARPAEVRVLAGALPLREAMAIVSAARAMVSNDSGLMHVAAAFGVPQVAVFGSTDPNHTPPLNDRARIVWLKAELGLPCMPCFDRTCRFGHYRCLTSIDAARVADALDETEGAPGLAGKLKPTA